MDLFALLGLSAESIIKTGGVLLIAAIVFAESGLLIGFFLPGDTLLFGAGLYAANGEISLPWLIIAVVVAAIIGDNVGYSIGRQGGKRLFNKPDSAFFRQEHLDKAEAFYQKHGGKTIIMARFMPIVRTFAPVVAGAGKMSRRRFMGFNVIGGMLWGAGMPLLGYFVGNRIPNLDKYIEVIMIVVMALSVLLAVSHLLRNRSSRN